MTSESLVSTVRCQDPENRNMYLHYSAVKTSNLATIIILVNKSKILLLLFFFPKPLT